MRWRHNHSSEGDKVSPKDLLACLDADSKLPVSMLIKGVERQTADDEKAVELFRVIRAYRGLTIFLVDGFVGGWPVGLAAVADLTIATRSSVFSFGRLGEHSASFVSSAIARLIGKARTIQILLDGEVSAGSLHEYGLVARLVSSREMRDPARMVEELFSDVVLDSVVRLKEAWNRQTARTIPDALAVERLEFRRCFMEGAADNIADFLGKRKRT